MILGWMLYSLVLTGCAVGAGHALELVARRLGRPTRGIWALALAISVGMSVVARSLPLGLMLPLLPPATTAPWLTPPATAFLHAYDPLGRWDPLLSVMLSVASGLAAAFFVVSLVRLVGRRRAWGSGVVDGHPVLVAESEGPAVVGFGRGTIVLPRWALSAEARLRGLMLAHELEHQRAGDPRLLLLALAAVVLQPWNPAVWWLARRLRLAVEVDCDARVLGHGSDVRTYGLLLLEVGRRAAACRLPAPAFSKPPSSLEERLQVMTGGGVSGGGGVRVAAMALVATLAVGVAVFVPEPSGLHCTLEYLGFPAAQVTRHPGR